MAAAAGAVAAAATGKSEGNAKLQHLRHAEAGGEQNKIGANRRARHSVSISDNSSSSDGPKGLVNGGTGGNAGELLVFDDDVQVPFEHQHSSNNHSTNTGGVVTQSKHQQQNQHQEVINRRSMNTDRQNQHQHTDLKRHRSSGAAPLSPSTVDFPSLAALPPKSPDSHEQLINPSSTSPTNVGGGALSLFNNAPPLLLKQNSSPPQSVSRLTVALSPNSTREFLTALHREQQGITSNTGASLLPSYADATGSSSAAVGPPAVSTAAGTTAVLPNVTVPPRKKFNVTRVTEDATKAVDSSSQTPTRPTNLVDYDPLRFFDTLGPLVSSTKTLADYRPGFGATAATTTGDSLSTATGNSRHHPQSAGNTGSVQFSSAVANSNTHYQSTTNAEEAIPFLLNNSQYRLPAALRRSQRARSEYLPYPAVSATSQQQQQPTPQEMVSSFRLGGCLGTNGGNGNGPPTGTTSSTVAAAVRGSTLGAALLTGSPMSTLPYKAPTKSPRYLPVSIQAAGYAPTTMEMQDLPPLGSADSGKHLDTSNNHHNHHHHDNHHNHHAGYRDYAPPHASALVATVSASALTGTVDSVHDSRILFDKPSATTAAGSEFLTVPTPTHSNFNHSRSANLVGEHATLATPYSHETDPHLAAVRMAVQNSADAGNYITGGSMSRPNFHRSTTLPLYMAESSKSPAPPSHSGFGHRPGKKRARARLLHRTGNYNMIGKNIPHRRIRLVSDIWNTLVDLQWRYILLLFLLSYFLTWTLFAFIYWLISLSHGDFDPENLNSADWRPCVQNLRSFTTAYLFSVESQHTIGYGFRYITDECAEAIIFLCLQSAIGAAIQAFMTGLVFTKVQRPTKRAQTLLFSKHAVLCTRDGQLCLLFRVGNMRRSLIIQSSVTAQLVHHRKTIEGELLPFHQHEMHIQLDSMSSSAFLAWPMTACHIINDESPLYDLDKQSMQNARFELIVTLEGVIESTGQTLQARTSYLPEEILWGFRFAKLLSYRQSSGQYVVNFERFHKVEIAPETPVCSAAQLEVAKRAFVARQLEDEDEQAHEDEMLKQQHYRQQSSMAANFDNGAGLITNDSGDEDDDDDAENDDPGKLPMSAPPFTTAFPDGGAADGGGGLPKSRVATITSLLAHEADHTQQHSTKSESVTSSNHHSHVPSAAAGYRRANFFSGGEDHDLNETATTANTSPNSSSATRRRAPTVTRKFSQQSHTCVKPNVYERKSSGDLPVLFTLGPPPSTAAVSTHPHGELHYRDSLSRHVSDAELENPQQRKRGVVGKVMLGSSDGMRTRNPSEADNSNMPSNRAYKTSASFSRPKSHSNLRVAAAGGGLQPPAAHSLTQSQFSDEEHKKATGLEGAGGGRNAAGFETEQESAAHVWTSPENRKYLELLKKELPDHEQQMLRRRKPSTNKKLHHGAEPTSDADAYEESMARMRRLGSILDDPKYTFDLTAEAEELGTSSGGGLTAPVRPLRTHQRVSSMRTVSSDRISDDDGEGGYIRDDEPEDIELAFPPKPASTAGGGGKKSFGGATSLKGSSVRLSDLVPNMHPHDVADDAIAEEADSPTHHQNIVVVMPPTRVQSDSQITADEHGAQQAGHDTVRVHNETAAHHNNFRQSIGTNNAVHHAEMGRRSTATAAVGDKSGSSMQRHHSHTLAAGHLPSRPRQSRHASVKRTSDHPQQQQVRTNSTVETEPNTWLPFPVTVPPPPQHPPPPAPP